MTKYYYREAFKTDDQLKCCQIIVEKGDLEVSSQERRDAIQKKKLEVVNYIHKYYIDPKTKKPHPVIRIENALTEIKAKYDPDVSTEKQSHDLADKIIKILPIKKSSMSGVIKVGHQYVGSVSGIIKKFCFDTTDSYGATGCTYSVGFLPGDYDIILSNLQKITQGNYSFEVDGLDGTANEVEETTKKGKRNAKKGKK